MASIDVEIGSRRYTVSCRDGEEEQLRGIAALVDQRARDAVTALGQLSETRQLLFAALLLADDLQEARATAPADAAPDAKVVSALESLADRIEALAARLESGGDTP